MKRKIIHGECVLFEIDTIPNNSKKINIKENDFIIGDSETVGNYHKIETKNVSIFNYNDTFVINAEKESKIFCPDNSRHDSIILPKGIWELHIAKEFDYLGDNERKVID